MTKISLQKLIIRLSAASVLLASAASAHAGSTCVVYMDANFEGESWTMNENDWMTMGSCDGDVRTEDGRVGWCSSHWNDTISSFRVGNGCGVKLWSDEDYGKPAGSHFWRGRGHDVRYVGDAWNDQASFAQCVCDGPNQ